MRTRYAWILLFHILKIFVFSLPFPEARLCAHAFGVCFWSSIIGLFGGIPLSDARGEEKEGDELQGSIANINMRQHAHLGA